MTDYDKEYWEKNLKTEECYDPLASSISELKQFQEYASAVEKILPHVIKKLDKEREQIVKETEKTFSDILSLIDAVNDIGDESTTYEMAVKICEHYNKTKPPL